MEYGAFGKELERRRLQFLGQVSDARSILMLGDGDGRFLRAFVERNPNAYVDFVDVSARMLAIAEKRLHANPQVDGSRVRFWCADACTHPVATRKYDLIVSHFFLDCFDTEEVELLVSRVALAAAPGTRWLISEFRQPHSGIAAWGGRLLLAALYGFFKITTGLKTGRLPDYQRVLRGQGFSLARAKVTWAGLLTSEIWTLQA
jgi:ubiquinone/menaquinone biosynthesis C-methylase UbiE